MKTHSAKAKGRRLQQAVVRAILDKFPELSPDDVQSRSMGAGGEDIMLSPAARRLLPVSIECKNVEAGKLIYQWYSQACFNAGLNFPVVVMHRNNEQTLAVVSLEDMMTLLRAFYAS